MGIIWSDHVEVPLAEEVEKYRLELSADDGSGATLSYQLAVPQTIVSAIEIDPFLVGNVSNINARIQQIGAYGLSEALTFDIPL